MEKIYLEGEIGEVIGVGAEGKVTRLSDDKVAKYFYYNQNAINKINKIKEIKKMDIKNITNPREIIYINNEIKGYTMDYINYEMTLKHCMQSKRTLEEKINYLKQMEKIIKELHKNNVVLVDLMYHNFVISDKVVKAIDIDNYHLDNYNTDFIPSTIFDSYLENINCKIDSDMDKYNNSFFMLYYLCNQSFKPSQAHGDIEFFQSFISKLNISNNLKNLFIEIMSDSTNKPYLDDNIDELKSNRSFI